MNDIGKISHLLTDARTLYRENDQNTDSLENERKNNIILDFGLEHCNFKGLKNDEFRCFLEKLFKDYDSLNIDIGLLRKRELLKLSHNKHCFINEFSFSSLLVIRKIYKNCKINYYEFLTLSCFSHKSIKDILGYIKYEGSFSLVYINNAKFPIKESIKGNKKQHTNLPQFIMQICEIFYIIDKKNLSLPLSPSSFELVNEKVILANCGNSLHSKENKEDMRITSHYSAPEVLIGERPDKASASWNLGTILCFLIYGKKPSYCNYSKYETTKIIAEIYCLKKLPYDLSQNTELMKIIKNLLKISPLKRISIADAYAKLKKINLDEDLKKINLDDI